MHKARVLNTLEIGALVARVNEGRLTDAESGARALLALHPDAGILWKILSVALVRQGTDALEALRRTADLMPQDAEAQRNLGAALCERRQWALGLDCLQRALVLAPQDAQCLIDAADAMRALGRARESIPLYQRALRVDSGLIEARNNLGNAFLEIAHFAQAATCYRTALDMRPDDAQILCNLSNAQAQLGEWDEAIGMARRALLLEPTLSAAHNNLGLLLATTGYPEKAAESFRHALTLDPCYIDALNNLGNVLRDVGRRREALALYARAIELDPGRVESHRNLGTALFELGRTGEAAASYSQALAIKPDYAPAHLSLGLAMRQQRRPSEAESSCQTALSIDPNYVEALSFLGELRADRGRFEEAEQLFQRALALNPQFSFAYFSIATHRKMTRDDRAWLEGAQALASKRLPLGHAISLHYALGKYFDDVGEYDAAFGDYREANELTKRYGFTYDAHKLTQRVDHIVQSFDGAFIERHVHAGSRSQAPVFIVGMPRSGTSLTEQILASHPAVYGAGELPFWDAAFTAFAKAQLPGAVDSNLLHAIAGDYLARLTATSGAAQRVVDKMPANFLYAGLIHAAFPNARIIHMQRHPIDTCLSIYFQNFLSTDPYANDLDNLAHYYSEYMRVANHWRTVLPASALLEVPYEELVADQEGWSRRMLDFLGLTWDPKCLDFHETERVVITASKWQVRQKINSSSTGRWKHYRKFVGPLQRLLNSSSATPSATPTGQ
jgi:tetratricopeptide (TPR) repeat protein